MAEYWLADSEARVLGPVSMEVITTLHSRGKLADVRAVSRDGSTFVPLREIPELQAVLATPATISDTLRAQLEATRQIREWLRSIEKLPSHEVLKVPATASRGAWRAAFFTLVHRYVPGRLPPDTSEELRLACEDAFLVLSERMVDVERRFRAPQPPPPPPLPVAPVERPPPVTRTTVRAGLVQISIALKSGDARPFTQDAEHTWQQDCMFISSPERAVPGTAAEVAVSFEGHVTQLHAAGRVLAARVGGFTVKLLNLGEMQRSVIRTWVARATDR